MEKLFNFDQKAQREFSAQVLELLSSKKVKIQGRNVENLFLWKDTLGLDRQKDPRGNTLLIK